MKKIMLVFVIAFVAVAFKSNAQKVEKTQAKSARASQVYLEAGGSGILYTVNFDTRLQKMENGLGFRIGVGGATYFALPIQFNYLLGTNGKYVEIGAGVSIFQVYGDFYINNGDVWQTYASGVLGYRSQPVGKRGLTWRVAFTPLVGHGGFTPFGGASVGFRF